jgi:hypothetical protein
MPRLGFFVALPALMVPVVLLIGREPIHPVLLQHTMDGRRGDRHGVKSLQVAGDLARTEVIPLAQIQDLADHVRRRRSGRAVRRTGPVAKRGLPVGVKPPLPLVEGLPGNAEMPASPRHIARARGLLQHPKSPRL